MTHAEILDTELAVRQRLMQGGKFFREQGLRFGLVHRNGRAHVIATDVGSQFHNAEFVGLQQNSHLRAVRAL